MIDPTFTERIDGLAKRMRSIDRKAISLMVERMYHGADHRDSLCLLEDEYQKLKGEMLAAFDEAGE